MATLLEIITTAANELGLPAPSTVESTTDLQTVQLVALTNRDCVALYREHDWTDLQVEHIINIEAALNTVGDVTEGSTTVSNIADLSGVEAGSYAVSGTGQPQAQRVAEIIDDEPFNGQIRLEMKSTATATATPLIFARDTYDIPTDFDRFITQTWWDRTNQWRLIGPDSPQTDQLLRSGIFTSGPRRRFRQVGRRPTAYRIWPPPFSGGAPAPGALVFEYVSKNWVEKADGTFAAKFTEDDDICLLDDQLVIMGVKWRMWQIKGFEYAAMQQEYLDAVSAKFAGDGGIPDLYLNRRSGPYLLSNANVVDGNYPSGS